MSDWDLSNVSSVLCIFVNSVIDNNSKKCLNKKMYIYSPKKEKKTQLI